MHMKASALIKDLQTEDGPRGAWGRQGGDGGGGGGTLKGTRANRRWQISGGGGEQTRGGDADCCEGENKEQSGEMRPAHGGGTE